ncbi:MAG: hypothetical protein FK734_20605, partial [Asgard group archaeon]|nr:hypothetical protein [Asgard group archaeon]
RKPWFATPCCPSNVSRIWASIGKYIYSISENEIWIHQYIGNKLDTQINNIKAKLAMTSEMPWNGKIKLELELSEPYDFTLNIRIPSWTENPTIEVNDERISNITKNQEIETGGGYSPYSSIFIPIKRKWNKQNHIILDFPMKVKIHKGYPKVKAIKNKIAFTRGPLVYCFESSDNPGKKTDRININQNITELFDKTMFGGIIKLQLTNYDNQTIDAIPYFLWANREPSEMYVWVKR